MSHKEQRELAGKYGVDLDTVSLEDDSTLEREFVFRMSRAELVVNVWSSVRAIDNSPENRDIGHRYLIDALKEKIRQIEPGVAYPY